MSRIVALLHRDRRPAELETLQRLVAPLRIQGSDGPRFRVEGSAGLAFQCLRASAGPDQMQPAELGASLSICFDGRLDNREELIGELRAELPAEPASLPDALLALACYRRFGEAFAGKLNGDFALALFDGDRRRMLLARDVMGVRPLYYWSSGDTFIAASEIKAILAHPRVDPQPDEEALADYLLGGDPTELRLTLFRGVRRVLPGYTVVAEPDGLRELRHWDFDPTRQVRCGSITEYAEVLRGLFEQAVRRRLRSSAPVAVTVSGGLDSSAILCQAERLKRAGAAIPPVHGISLLYPEGSAADERRYLEEIEAQYGVSIVRVPPSPIRYSREPDWVWTIESPGFTGESFLECLRAARGLSCSTLLEGYYGDQILWSRAHLYDLIRSFRWMEARSEFRALSGSMRDTDPKDLLRQLLRAFVRELMPDSALKAFRFARRLLGQASSPGCYSQWLRDVAYRRSQQQRSPAGPFASKNAEHCYKVAHAKHVTIGFEMASHIASRSGLDIAYPFADRDLIAFIMAIPGEIVSWRGIFKGLYRESMRGVLPESIRLRYDKAEFGRLECDAAAELSTAGLEKNLGAESLAVQRGYVDAAKLPDALARLQAELKTGTSIWPATQTIELLALEVWMQTFFGKGCAGSRTIGLR